MNNLKPTSNNKIHLAGGQALGLSKFESYDEFGLWLFNKTLPASLEAGGRTSGLSNDESTDDFGRWLFANPPASLEVGGRALGLSNHNASVNKAKMEKMRITWLRGALERSRYAQMSHVCGETSITAPGVPGGTGLEHD